MVHSDRSRGTAAPLALPAFLLLLPLLLVLPDAPAHGKVRVEGILNPHADPDACGSCHEATPTKEEAKAGEYRLLGRTIDATCHICHTRMCCEVNALHSFDHKSDVNRWDRSKFRAPKTLPLHGGYITCSTCHLHDAAKGGGDPKCAMVRICNRTLSRIEWIDLCRDCHTRY